MTPLSFLPLTNCFQNTKVTLVHGDTQLLNKTYPDKFRYAMEQSLRSRGIEILLEEYIDSIPENGASHVTTRSGKKISADLVVS